MSKSTLVATIFQKHVYSLTHILNLPSVPGTPLVTTVLWCEHFIRTFQTCSFTIVAGTTWMIVTADHLGFPRALPTSNPVDGIRRMQ